MQCIVIEMSRIINILKHLKIFEAYRIQREDMSNTSKKRKKKKKKKKRSTKKFDFAEGLL